ncbi:sensor histidine kinase [Jiella mangrovi]|uniref:histidine kinase n=1 Tax=Jiella mangrovi TaxID=2821407 RepID=A0ABS4BKW9_9HYPH|nr:sensor histidine kinase [Jiella mangrovi]MBP0616805.1 hypothetical protein [Jiella mangrovi]
MTDFAIPPDKARSPQRWWSRAAMPSRRFVARGLYAKAAFVFVPAAFLATAAFALVVWVEAEAIEQLHGKTLEQIVDIAVIDVNAHLRNGVTDAGFLADDRTLRQWLETGGVANRQRLEEQLVEFLGHKPQYNSARLLDIAGQEVLRVDVNAAGQPVALAQHLLQDKASRYYFEETIGLPDGNFYISRLDLNVERGVIEVPIRPTLRFAAPVFHPSGERRGVLVLNYNARDLLEDLRRKAIGRGGEVWLIDEAGYWLLGPDPTVEWAFMYHDRQSLSFAAAHGAAWEAMRNAKELVGAASTATGEFAFAAVDRTLAAGNPGRATRPRWYAVAFLSPERAKSNANSPLLAETVVWAGTLVLFAAASLAIGSQWQRRSVSEAKVRDLAHQLETDNMALASVNRELEAFSYSVSHDLRTPLRSIDGFSLALYEDYGDTLDPEGRRYLERIRLAAQRMGHLIDDLLGLARVTTTDIRPTPIDVTQLARTVVDAVESPHPVRWTIEPGMPAVADAGLLQILLENLLGNAVKFTAKADHAEISVGRRGRGADTVFFVADNGAGFDMEHAGRLFGAFQRLHADTYPGTGIGLATAQRIVSRHGGRIWAEASPDLGATFFFTLGKPGP